MYWCSSAAAGMRTPMSLPTARDQMPAAMTTVSHAMGPLSVNTWVILLLLDSNPVTRVPCRIFTPPARAPFASACVRLDGSTYPSLGTQAAPATPSSVM